MRINLESLRKEFMAAIRVVMLLVLLAKTREGETTISPAQLLEDVSNEQAGVAIT